jgi:mono/diheme cytochrome c family protein
MRPFSLAGQAWVLAMRLLSASLFSLCLVGCAASINAQGDGGPIGADSATGDGAAPSDGAAAVSDLPCAVRDFLENNCSTCHGAARRGGVPAMMTRADLLAPSSVMAGQNIAQRAVVRLMDSMAPMPPGGVLPAATQQPFVAWVQAGAPAETCGAGPATGPFAVPPQCSTGTMWTRGNRGSDNMNPGQACISCHTPDPEAPGFSIAGTVYQTGHEPNNCNGGGPANSDPITVEITDANGRVINLTPFVSGNFYLEAPVALPYRARVLYQGRARAMVAPQTSGDCNACHTQAGTMGAPGRVVLP